MPRHARWLRPNRETRIPPVHLCLATVCVPRPGCPGELELDQAGLVACKWAGGAFRKGPTEYALSARCLWTMVDAHTRKRGVTWIWCLNPAQDLPALQFTELVKGKHFERSWWVWSDPPIIITGKLFGRRVKIVGVGNWLDSVQADTDNTIPPVGRLRFTPDADLSASRKKIIWESRRCATLVEEILSFVHKEDLGHLCSTAGAQSLQAYRHKFCPEKLLVDNNQRAIDLERSAATGFPVRAWKRGRVEGPIHVVDVNSLYPYVMARYPYPRKRTYIGRCESVDYLKQALANHLCIARVTGDDPDRAYCVQRKHQCVYTHQLDNDVLAGPDLDSLVTRGHCVHCHEVACYEGADLFSEWAAWAFGLRARYRKKTQPVMAAIAKALGVALWGKFAAAPGRWAPAPPECPDHTDWGRFLWHQLDGTVIECRAIAGVRDMLQGKEEPENTIPAISAFVAAYARMFMANLVELAGPENVHYQVADALHVNQAGYDRLFGAGLVDDERFGLLKLAGSYDHAFYHGANVYRLGESWTWAGRAVMATESAPGVWSWEAPHRLNRQVFVPMDGSVKLSHNKVSLRGPGAVQE